MSSVPSCSDCLTEPQIFTTRGCLTITASSVRSDIKQELTPVLAHSMSSL